MTYGSVSSDTREIIVMRAAVEEINTDSLELEISDDVSISIIWAGALDEEFDMSGEYAEIVANWIGDDFSEKYTSDEWEILVSRDGTTIHTVTYATLS
jgi:hypothetical protein